MSDFTPEQVERAAKELWQNALRRGASHWKSWGAVDGYAKEEYLEFASAVLSAAGAPEKVAPVVDEAALAEVIHRAACGPVCKDESPMRFDYKVARAVAAYLRGESK